MFYELYYYRFCFEEYFRTSKPVIQITLNSFLEQYFSMLCKWYEAIDTSHEKNVRTQSLSFEVKISLIIAKISGSCEPLTLQK